MFPRLINSGRIYISIVVILLLIIRNGYAQNLEDEAINKGINYRNKGMYDEAVAEFTKAIEINPKSAIAYYKRGFAYHYKGELDEAISDYSKAIEIGPDNAEIYYNRGIAHYYNDNHYDQAISDWSKAIEINPNQVKFYNKRAFVYFKKMEYDKSWEDVHKVEELGHRVDPKFLQDLKALSKRER